MCDCRTYLLIKSFLIRPYIFYSVRRALYRIFYFLIHHIYLLKQRSSGICSFESKVETDLYEFAKKKTQPLNMTLSPRGDVFATMAEDRKIRLFRILTGKLITVIDESLQHYTELQQVN